MAKYHIALNGNHVICRANKKPCPRGEEYHFKFLLEKKKKLDS